MCDWVVCSQETHLVFCGYFSRPDSTSAICLAWERPDPLLAGILVTLDSSSAQGRGWVTRRGKLPTEKHVRPEALVVIVPVPGRTCARHRVSGPCVAEWVILATQGMPHRSATVTLPIPTTPSPSLVETSRRYTHTVKHRVAVAYSIHPTGTSSADDMLSASPGT